MTEPQRPTYGSRHGGKVGALDIVASAEVLDRALIAWGQRGDTSPGPTLRQAGTRATAALDVLMYDLQTIRSGLLREIQDSDEETTKKIDELLAMLDE
jgi:hypothetical protein